VRPATPCLTAADDAGCEIDEAEIIDWRDVPSVSRSFSLVRWLKADAQGATPGGRDGAAFRATKAKSNQPSAGNSEREEKGRHV
jgi:hypothetical protein